jgi:lysozyme
VLRRFPCAVLLFGVTGCTVDGDSLPISTRSEAVRVCAAGEVVEGIDVSKYQGTIDWSQVKAAGIEFAYIRVSDGSDGVPPVDPEFPPNWTGARAAGVLRGAYQFFRENEDPSAQADLLLDTMGPLDDDDLPAAIDVESLDHQTGATIVANVKAWMDRVEAGSGKKPIIYTGRPFWDDNTGSSTAVSDHTLWIPHWYVSCPSISVAWSTWGFWQYSSTGRVDGITGDVDRDRWNGDREALLAFAGVGVGVPDALAPPPPDAAAMLDPPDAASPPGGTGGCSLVGRSNGLPGALVALLLIFVRFPRRRERDKIRTA